MSCAWERSSFFLLFTKESWSVVKMDSTLNITSLIPTYNQTQEWIVLEDFVKSLVEDWRYQARVGNVIYTLLVLLYAGMILVGATGNILVILVSFDYVFISVLLSDGGTLWISGGIKSLHLPATFDPRLLHKTKNSHTTLCIW